MVNLIAGILTTPERPQYLPQLAATLDAAGIPTTFFNDPEHHGHTWNFRRMMESLLPMSTTDRGVLLLDDDMELCPDWLERFEIIRTAEPDVTSYSLFTRQRHLVKHADQGYARGIFKRGWYGCAVIIYNKPTFVTDVDTWYETKGVSVMDPKRAAHWDVKCQDYLVDTEQEWVVTMPTLAEHLGATTSTLGHGIGQSILYAKDLP